MRKIALVFSVLLIVGFASAFDVSVDTVKGEAGVDDPAEINLEVHNTDGAESFQLSIFDYHRSQWYLYEDSIDVEPGQNGTFNIDVSPDESAIRGNYRTDFLIRSSTGEEVRDSFSYRVNRDTGLNLINIDRNESYRPEDRIELGVVFRNVDSSTSEYKNVGINLMNYSKSIELGPIVPGGERRVSTEFRVPEYEEPGRKKLEIILDDRNYTETVLIEQVREFETNSSRENRVLVIQEDLRVKNTGNVESTYNHSVEKPSYIAPVVYAPEAETEEQGSYTVYSWSETLEPGESTTIEVRTDYWIPLASLFILLAGFLTLKRITSTVEVKKTVKKTEEGLDVTIEVENSSSRTYDDVILEDFIPNIAGLHSKFDMADPEVKQTDEGAELRWWITELQPGDQRIFRYNIKPKVEVEEGVELDPAILRDGDKVLDTSKEISTEFKPE
jgi:hypothetical protein